MCRPIRQSVNLPSAILLPMLLPSMTNCLFSREKLTAVDVSPGFICDFYSCVTTPLSSSFSLCDLEDSDLTNRQNNCSGHVRWAVQANPTSFFTSLPFLAGWDDRVVSMQCYASIWATDFHATIERREIHLEEEEAEIETVSVAQKFDTGISRRAEGNEVSSNRVFKTWTNRRYKVNIMATDNLNVFWILPIADGTKNCWNLADNVLVSLTSAPWYAFISNTPSEPEKSTRSAFPRVIHAISFRKSPPFPMYIRMETDLSFPLYLATWIAIGMEMLDTGLQVTTIRYLQRRHLLTGGIIS